MSSLRPRVVTKPRASGRSSRPAAESEGLSALAQGLVGSEILKIASEIRALQRTGASVCNLTVGDFSSSEFPIPGRLEEELVGALRKGQTNYPPADGVLDLRQEVIRFYERSFRLSYPLESILIAGGSRPLIYATYRTILDPGEKVLYPVPSWNNNHYAYLAGARAVELTVGPDTGFLPTAERIAPLARGVRLLCINSPLNPCGTVMTREQVRDIGLFLVEENRRRRGAGEKPLFAMWDQVYWTLTFGEARHFTPPELVPESTPYTILVDGISKAFAATGLRVGWSAAPPDVAPRMRDILGHVGAWGPRPEQVATARFLADADAIAAFHETMIRSLKLRLDRLHDGFAGMAKEGLPVACFPPQGAIYLSARFDLIGRRWKGSAIHTNEEIRRLLLEQARFAVVPFQAFGLKEETGWMRLSVGAVSPADIDAGLERVRSVLAAVK
jgi:aspartate aminotransferase